ncbi:MAG: phosphoribosylformylglycinamidine cyclo-ligase [Candidatus Margulisiibacteriota bacterium]
MDYKASGVNIEAGNRAVELIKHNVKRTFNPFVLAGLGSFGAPVAIPSGYKEPVLVSSTDGVGTKLKLAIDTGIFNTVGIDLVAMCVNDLLCLGAKPLFFLDYIACHQLVPEDMKTLIDGMVEGCLQAECALVGGEMAEMNDLYRPGEFDLAGFSVGVVEKSQLITGQNIQPGNYVYAIPSSGIHSNGYSLVRKVLTESVCQAENISMETLLTPTRIYVKTVMPLLEKAGLVTGLAHITGGGLAENTARVLPEGITLNLDVRAIPVPEIFTTMARVGNISQAEMDKVFNLGIGMIVITSEPVSHADLVLVGRAEAGDKQVHVRR